MNKSIIATVTLTVTGGLRSPDYATLQKRMRASAVIGMVYLAKCKAANIEI